jgi:putative toxin-antitoxin system antitoxin component (TIGR02293 family)
MPGKRPAPLPAPRAGQTSLRYQRAERLREALGLDPAAMAAHLGISAKTYARRSERGHLEDAESLKVEMLDVALTEATRVLGDADEARIWLETPILSLGGLRPLDHLHTIQGYERIKETLAKIEYGMY